MSNTAMDKRDRTASGPGKFLIARSKKYLLFVTGKRIVVGQFLQHDLGLLLWRDVAEKPYPPRYCPSSLRSTVEWRSSVLPSFIRSRIGRPDAGFRITPGLAQERPAILHGSDVIRQDRVIVGSDDVVGHGTAQIDAWNPPYFNELLVVGNDDPTLINDKIPSGDASMIAFYD